MSSSDKMKTAALLGVAIEIRKCARSWVPEARLIGNITAKEIDDVISDYLALRMKYGIDNEGK